MTHIDSTSTANVATPISHARSLPGASSVFSAEVRFKTANLPAGVYEIEGTASGPGGFAATLKAAAAVDDGWLVANVGANQPLPGTIEYDDMVIAWKVNRTINGHETSQAYGSSKNTSYITGAAAADAYETVLYIGCKNAAWKRPKNPGELAEDANHNGVLDPGEDSNGNGVLDDEGAAKDREVVDAVWAEFSDREVKRVDGKTMKYNHDDAVLPDDPGAGSTAAEMLRDASGRGRCTAWAELLVRHWASMG